MPAKRLRHNRDSVQLVEGIPDGKRITAPTSAERRTLWLLLTGGLLSVATFMYWFATAPIPGYWLLYLMLVITIGFKLLRLLHEWYHYAAMTVTPRPPITRSWRVDMLTTYCAGEPYDMVVATLTAMVAVRYPHQTYLCDETDDPYLKQVCQDLGVRHVYRGPDKTDAKAGNINFALEQVADGEICVILDPDHKPRPDFLERVLPYFEKEEVGFVQCVQAYSNQANSLIAKGAAEHTYHFYGPMMMTMNRYGTVQAIGANCTFRRAALDSIGGHAAGLSEDMHTAMCLHSKGWTSVYVPENLSRGLVPETLSAFYRQQLKWSRGTFDLLLYRFPKLVKGFSWRQILHYATVPLYFLTGLISAIDMFLPMLSLAMGRPPFLADLKEMVQVLIPVLIFLTLNRLYVQKWTLDRTEKGLHFWGGLLLLNTWWIYLLGFVLAILRVKVPYIPTPKEHQLRNEWRICLPNIVVMGLGVLSILYGLSIDWSPYSWFMAGLVATNIFLLGVGTLIAQRKLTHRLYLELLDGRWATARRRWSSFRYDVIYRVFRSKRLAGLLAIGILGLYVMVWGDFVQLSPRLAELEAQERPSTQRAYEGWLWGQTAHKTLLAQPAAHSQVHLLSFPADQQVPPHTIQRAVDLGYQPWLTWKLAADSSLSQWYRDIVDGCHDAQLKEAARSLRHPGTATLLALKLPAPTNVQQFAPYQAAWAYVAAFLYRASHRHLIPVWEGKSAQDFSALSPDCQWLTHWALETLSPKQALADLRDILDQQPWLASKQMFLTGVPSNSLSPSAAKGWTKLIQRVPALKGMLLSDSIPTAAPQLTQFAQGQGLEAAWLRDIPYATWGHNQTGTIQPVRQDQTSKTAADRTVIRRTSSGFALWVDGAPFYLKGVSYNPGHDWRDGFAPLVRETLIRDFRRIKALGANTIRRYSLSLYDRNLLNIAAETDLKVLCGFWFDPKVDYYRDTEAVAAYRAKAIAQVKRFRHHEAVLGWAVGNETWGMLKHHHSPSYLPRVRRAYVEMVEQITQDIHRLDPQHPVFSMLEHSEELADGLWSFSRYAPSIDVLGVNSYYQARISRLDSLVQAVVPDKPYLVSEFGPKGYWVPAFNQLDSHYRLVEESDLEKAQGYYRQWTQYIQPHQGANIGGVAFCWRDRMEGSRTWFGLTDFHNRLKLGYYALHQAWTGDTLDVDWPDVRVVIRPFFPQEYEARIVMPQEDFSKYQVSWQLMQDEYLQEVGKIKPLPQDARIASISLPHIPDSHHRYRVYVFLEDDQHRVLTASAPISLPYSP